MFLGRHHLRCGQAIDPQPTGGSLSCSFPKAALRDQEEAAATMRGLVEGEMRLLRTSEKGMLEGRPGFGAEETGGT